MPTNTPEKHAVREQKPRPAMPHKKAHEQQPHKKHHDKPHAGHHEKKPHPRGKGIELVGKQDELLQRLIIKKDDWHWAAEQVANEGPDHKQVHAALLLKRMFELLVVLEKKSAIPFKIQAGEKLHISRHGEINGTPLTMPKASLEGTDEQKVLEMLSGAPEHELVLFSSLLQTVEWAIKIISKEIAGDPEMKKN